MSTDTFKTGSQALFVKKDTRLIIHTDSFLMVFDQVEADPILTLSSNSVGNLSIHEDQELAVHTIPTGHWYADVQHINPYEESDPVPVEVPDDRLIPETLEQKLHRMLGKMVAERYGRTSDEFETFEESMDFDDDDGEDLLSGFEVNEMSDIPESPPEPEPIVAPKPETIVAPQPETTSEPPAPKPD